MVPIEACHRIDKRRNSSKKSTIVRVINEWLNEKGMIKWKCLININKSLLSLSSSDNIFINKNLIPMNNKIAFYCRNFTWNCQIDKTYPREGVIYIASSNIKYGNVIKILYNSILSDVFSDFDPDVREEEQNDKSKNHCNQATEFKYPICIFIV